jgi:hypothetical protein
VVALGSSVDSLTDAHVAPYADAYYQYDPEHRVIQATVQGAGCTTCGGSGLGTFRYANAARTFPNGVGNWQTKTVQTLVDGSTNTVYTSYLGQVPLTCEQNTSHLVRHHKRLAIRPAQKAIGLGVVPRA